MVSVIEGFHCSTLHISEHIQIKVQNIIVSCLYIIQYSSHDIQKLFQLELDKNQAGIMLNSEGIPET